MARLGNTERRAAILDAALPLFARKGFTATTTKEIAQAAGVSEALIFKHFPSKAALHEAIFRSCLDEDGELERLLAMEPGTATLVTYVRALIHYYVLEIPADPANLLPRHRLTIMSLLEDGEFARLARRWVTDHILPSFTASLRAAQAAGDLVPTVIVPENAFWLADLLGAMMATACLPDTPVIPLLCQREQAARQAEAFILRGIGLRDDVIAAHAEPPLPTPEPSRPNETDDDQ
ncbi:TetR/AcrR family transcriptional regulator [Azospirillum sp. sgz302134]